MECYWLYIFFHAWSKLSLIVLRNLYCELSKWYLHVLQLYLIWPRIASGELWWLFLVDWCCKLYSYTILHMQLHPCPFMLPPRAFVECKFCWVSRDEIGSRWSHEYSCNGIFIEEHSRREVLCISLNFSWSLVFYQLKKHMLHYLLYNNQHFRDPNSVCNSARLLYVKLWRTCMHTQEFVQNKY